MKLFSAFKSNKRTGIPEGQEVDGWYIGEEAVRGNTVEIVNDTTLDLRLKTRMFTVTVMLPQDVTCQGSNTLTQEVASGSPYTLPSVDEIIFPDNLEFLRWRTDSDNSIVEGSIIVKEDTVIWMEVTVKKAKVTFILPEGASVSSEYKTEYEIGIQKVIAPFYMKGSTKNEIVIPADKEFVQWNYKGEKYDNDTLMPADGIVLELILKDAEVPPVSESYENARWEFDGDMKTTADSTISVTAGKQGSGTLPELSGSIPIPTLSLYRLQPGGLRFITKGIGRFCGKADAMKILVKRLFYSLQIFIRAALPSQLNSLKKMVFM